MDKKVFLIFCAALLAVILGLGGVYYYLFGYDSKTSNYTRTLNQTTNLTTNPQTNLQTSVQNEQNNTILNENIYSEQNESTQNTYLENNQTNAFIKQNLDENKTTNLKQKQIPKQEKESVAKNQKVSKETKPVKTAKAYKKTAKKQNCDFSQSSDLSAVKEYQIRGKTALYSKPLSTKEVKVYVLCGKDLTTYRKGVLKDLLSPIYKAANGLELRVFVNLLSKNKMQISIYNKELMFGENAKNYELISLQSLSDYLDDLPNLYKYVKEMQVIERVQLNDEKTYKGSEFSQHLQELKTSLSYAPYFMKFSKVVEILPKK